MVEFRLGCPVGQNEENGQKSQKQEQNITNQEKKLENSRVKNVLPINFTKATTYQNVSDIKRKKYNLNVLVCKLVADG